jgi:hypothetical protein
VQASEIAIHEMGHSAFGLADEYENGGTARGTEPSEPNVTRDANHLVGVLDAAACVMRVDVDPSGSRTRWGKAAARRS